MTNAAVVKRAVKAASAEIAQLKAAGMYFDAIKALDIPPEPAGQIWSVDREGFLWFRAFVKNGGLVLNPKFWRVDDGAAGAVCEAIEQALRSGADPIKAAAAFIYGGPVNDFVHTQVDPQDYNKVTDLFEKLIHRIHTR